MRLFWPGLFAIAVNILSGCASNELYRHDYAECRVSATSRCDSSAVQLHSGGTAKETLLGFIEIDDQGQLRDRSQLKAVLDALYQASAKDSLLINVFVHGWHHNAAPDDANVASFKESLEQLSALENNIARGEQRLARRVVGVYVGWRGESITTPILNNLTFWERKSTAQDIGHLGLAELLLKFEEIANVKNTQPELPKSRLVILGHSFGGAAVYSATSQILASRFIDSRSDKSFTDTAKGFGDLVVLLNPAFEALQYAPLFDLAQARCSYFPQQTPRLVVLTSEADWATRLAFPAGRFFSTFFESHKTLTRNDCGHTITVEEGRADRNTVGHYAPLISHTLTPVQASSMISALAYDKIRPNWQTQVKGASMRVGETMLTHTGTTNPLNPFMNVFVDSALIGNHNDVFRPEITEFLRLLIILSTSD